MLDVSGADPYIYIYIRGGVLDVSGDRDYDYKYLGRARRIGRQMNILESSDIYMDSVSLKAIWGLEVY